MEEVIKEWNKLSTKQKLSLMTAAPELYYAVARVVRTVEITREMGER